MDEPPRQLSFLDAQTDPGSSLRRSDVTVADTLPAYERYLIGSRKAAQTVAGFTTDIRQLAAFYPQRPLSDLSTAHLQTFLGHLQRDHRLSEKTITRKTTALKSYGAFLVAAKLLASDPAASLVYPALHLPLPEVLSPEEMQRLLQAAQEKPLWYALIATLRYAGAKREEALALRREDVAFGGPAPTIALRKRRPSRYGRDRIVPLTEPLRQILRQYLAGLEGPYLFPLHVRSVKWGLAHYAQRAGIGRPISAETLRDTFAVSWLQERLASEAELARLGLEEALAAVREQHDRGLIAVLGLAEGTRHAEEAVRAYRTLVEVSPAS
jgi:site-specific recombinase XerD